MFCSNCGSKIIDGAMFCKECGTKILIIDETHNKSDYSNHEKDVIDEKLQQAKILADRGVYYKTKQLYEELIPIAPDNYEVWWGLLKYETTNLTRWSSKFEELYNNTLKYLPEEKREEVNSSIEQYKNKGLFWFTPKVGDEFDIIGFKLHSDSKDKMEVGMQTNYKCINILGNVVQFFRSGDLNTNEDFKRLCTFMDNLDYNKIREDDKLWGISSDFEELRRMNVLNEFFTRLSNKEVRIKLKDIRVRLFEDNRNTREYDDYKTNSFEVNHYFEDVMKDLIENSKHPSKCYITSAVCESFNKEDNCDELVTFRKFRDDWLIKQVDGSRLIQKYYDNAPKIIKRIMQENNSHEILGKIWEDYLFKCYQLLLNNNYDECKSLYIRMVENLEVKYGI